VRKKSQSSDFAGASTILWHSRIRKSLLPMRFPLIRLLLVSSPPPFSALSTVVNISSSYTQVILSGHSRLL
jgi:hypothetical protein